MVGIRGRGWAGRAQKAFVELETLNVSEQFNASEFIIITEEVYDYNEKKACQLTT